jgi:hypothetical protein
MRTAAATLTIVLLVTGIFVLIAVAQDPVYMDTVRYYNNLAAKCQNNPVALACIRSHAAYWQCLAIHYNADPSQDTESVCGRGSVGEPSCPAYCPSSPTTGSNPVGTGTTPTANATANNLNNAVNLGVQLWSIFHRPKSENGVAIAPAPEQPEPVPTPADPQADAANLLSDSNALLSSLNSGSSSAGSPNAVPNLDSLFDSDQPSNTSTSAISSLLDDSGQTGSGSPDPTSTIAGLLTQPPSGDTSGINTDGTSNVTNLLQQPPSTQPLPASLAPQDQQINAALQESVDQPDSGQTGSLAQMFQSTGQAMKDGLDNIVTTGKTLATSLANDPIVQWAASDHGSLTTMPLPARGDSPDTAANKVFGQSVVGFGDLLKGMANGPFGFAKGLYLYGTKMVNQIGADLGLANDTILGTDQENSN